MKTFGRVTIWVLLIALTVGALTGMGWTAKRAIRDGDRTATATAKVLDHTRCDYSYTFTVNGAVIKGKGRRLKPAGKTQACTSSAREEVASMKVATIYYDPSNLANHGDSRISVWLYLLLEFLFLMMLGILALGAYFIRDDFQDA